MNKKRIWMKEIRLNKGWDQVDLARIVNLNPSYICELEQGNKNPSLATACKLADVLGVKPEKFLP
ncbi:helix-turn-helix transcriptional regulator (plasmid) [Bacillus carboniphilus]|uniref:Helix-turn-helix transcriptional regulator n=1 Tax=Bacillus carboniphilus TaxID=86663 RepID=A0ABY9K1M0_9BACI|nr:helix-turn-helix transcriptional regulator [Bacillus carboniphilus]WLR44508.1 helix-turn-helix transcriptional regulator [Bacillus carboniphilus]